MADRSERKTFSARISADLLHRMEPLIRAARETFRADVWGLGIEPCTEGGVILSATNGTTAIMVRDPDGRTSRPARICIPDELLRAVTPPAPIRFVDQGDIIPRALPDWAQPGKVLLFDEQALVESRASYPGDDEEDGCLILGHVSKETDTVESGGYRVYDGPPVPWRNLMKHHIERRPTEAQHVDTRFNPILLEHFRRFLCTDDEWHQDGENTLIDFVDEGGPHLIRAHHRPEFIGIFMGLREFQSPPALPSWLEPAKEEVSHA